MSESPIELLLDATDRLDADAAIALFAPDCRLLATDGRRAEGTAAIREMLVGFFSTVRSTTHRIIAQWHVNGVWIAEADVNYELKDGMKTGAIPRAFILRDGPEGLIDARVYGAHERPLGDHPSGEQGLSIDARWIPPL